MAMFAKGQRLNRAKLKREKFPLPELETEPGAETYIWLRALTAKEVRDMEKNGSKEGYELIAMSAEDDNREPAFAHAADAAESLEVSAETILAMIAKIGEISGINVDRSKKLTEAEALAFHLCLRFGGEYIHPDYLLDNLTGGQFLDWVQFHRQFNVTFHREDLLWGFQRAEFINAHMIGEGDLPIENPIEVMPYADPDDMFREEKTVEQIIGIVQSAKAAAQAKRS